MTVQQVSVEEVESYNIIKEHTVLYITLFFKTTFGSVSCLCLWINVSSRQSDTRACSVHYASDLSSSS